MKHVSNEFGYSFARVGVNVLRLSTYGGDEEEDGESLLSACHDEGKERGELTKWRLKNRKERGDQINEEFQYQIQLTAENEGETGSVVVVLLGCWVVELTGEASLRRCLARRKSPAARRFRCPCRWPGTVKGH